MRIDHINTLTTGGAAVAALRLHAGLREAGVESRFCYKTPRKKQEPSNEVPAASEPVQWSKPPNTRYGQLKNTIRRRLKKQELKRALQDRPAGLELFTLPTQETSTPLDFAARETDVIHLHWISNFVDYASFFAGIDDRMPIVWTLHDMNPLTGGCHYAYQCDAYQNSRQNACQLCPQVGPSAPAGFVNDAWETKLAALEGKNLHLVAPSRWMEQCARDSTLGKAARSVRTIYHGLDLQSFSPQDKPASKRHWGLPEGALTVGCGAASLRNPRKGFQDLLAALTQVVARKKVNAEETIYVLSFGQAAKNVSLPPGVQLHSLGTINDVATQAVAYSAMDVFALPSLAESFGLVSAEAMACGVPVVAYAATAVPEYVLQGQTGLLSEVGDIAGLADDLEWMFNHRGGRMRMGNAARAFTINHFDERDQLASHQELYRSLVEGTAQEQAA